MRNSVIVVACLLFCFIDFSGVQSNPVDEASLNALPQAIRQSQSPLVQVLLNSSSSSTQEEVFANVTNELAENASNTSLTDIENDNLTHSLQLRYRER